MVRVFIIEDESYIRKGLKVQLKELNENIKIVGESASIREAVLKVEKVRPNLVLLDINLIDGTGFDFLEQTKFKDFKVIFITSYDNHAIKALKLGAVDYILKPIDIDELSNAINKVEELYKDLFLNEGIDSSISISFINGSQLIELNELVYCKSDKGYTTFFMNNKKSFLSSKPLKVYEQKLLDNKFIRTHQSYFVNSKFIERFDSKKRILFLKNKVEVPVAARKIVLLNSFFNS